MSEAESPQPHIDPPQEAVVVTPDNVRSIWGKALGILGDMTEDYAAKGKRVAISAPNRLAVSFPAQYTSHMSYCERPEKRNQIEVALSRIVGQPMKVDFELLADDRPARAPTQTAVSSQQIMREKMTHPLVVEAMEIFKAEIARVVPPVNKPADS